MKMRASLARTLTLNPPLFLFDEPFSRVKLVAFGFIWAALVIYSWSVLRRARG